MRHCNQCKEKMFKNFYMLYTILKFKYLVLRICNQIFKKFNFSKIKINFKNFC